MKQPTDVNSSAEAVSFSTGSGNVFADFNFPEAEDEKLKVELAIRLSDEICKLGLSQQEVAGRLGLKQPNVSALMKFRLRGFSSARLMTLLARLGHNLSIRISPTMDGARGSIQIEHPETKDQHFVVQNSFLTRKRVRVGRIVITGAARMKSESDAAFGSEYGQAFPLWSSHGPMKAIIRD